MPAPTNLTPLVNRFRGNAVFSLIAAILTFVFLLILGVPYPLLLAVLVAVLALIPVIGSFLAGVIVASVAFNVSLPVALGTVAFVVIYQVVEEWRPFWRREPTVRGEGNQPTLAEDLLLLLLHPTTGRPVDPTSPLDSAIGGALLLDLFIHGRVAPESDHPRARLAVQATPPIGDPLLGAALARLPGKPVKAWWAIRLLAHKQRQSVLDRLAARGVVRRHTKRVLGLIPITTWPAADPGSVTALRERLTAVLRGGAEPDQHLACLISLLHAIEYEHRLVDGPYPKLRARAAEVSNGDRAGPVVRSVAAALSRVDW